MKPIVICRLRFNITSTCNHDFITYSNAIADVHLETKLSMWGLLQRL